VSLLGATSPSPHSTSQQFQRLNVFSDVIVRDKEFIRNTSGGGSHSSDGVHAIVIDVSGALPQSLEVKAWTAALPSNT
jgi:hypothetical protein